MVKVRYFLRGGLKVTIEASNKLFDELCNKFEKRYGELIVRKEVRPKRRPSTK